MGILRRWNLFKPARFRTEPLDVIDVELDDKSALVHALASLDKGGRYE